jgi:glycine/D-amino acid oxidase-like deaminating enzyme
MHVTDIAIIGGGIIGVMIANEIVNNNKNVRIALMERSMTCQGASMYSAGVHFPRGCSERVRKMSYYSHLYYQELAKKGGVPIFSLPMLLISSVSQRTRINSHYLAVTQLQPTRQLEVDWAELMFPVDAEMWTGQGCNYADVPGLVKLLVQKLRHTITLYEGVNVESVEKQHDYVIHLSTGESLQAKKVVLAPGPWLAEPAWQERLTRLNIRVKKIVAAHIDVKPQATDGLIIFHDEDAFLLPCHQHGYWLFSYTCNEWDVNPNTLARSMTAKDLADAREVLARYSPTLAQRINSGRVFCDAYSENREPVITTLDDADLIFAGGANGSGYRLAPAIAAEVVSLL